jgi:endonuclease/exonuclease/phosphatase family metal-dependent hydrolase
MLTRSRRIALLALSAVLTAALLTAIGCTRSGSAAAVHSDGYLFCFWNLENLFDDHADQRTGADHEYDAWFARDPAALKLKLDHLCDALLRLNNGRGPDILAAVEVESLRAAELLRDALNQRLADPALHYQHILMKEVRAGRHISPVILTRLPVMGNKTQLHGRGLRILEGHIVVNNHDLVVLATHWTSRVTDEHGEHRAKYGDQVYGVFKGMHRSNPAVSMVVCGDCNDPPDAPSVTQHLHAVGNLGQVRTASPSEPLLFNLFADKDAEAGFGTHYYAGRWYIFDQLAVAPSLVGGGAWSCDVGSAQTVNNLARPGDRHKRPWRFGNPHDKFERGYSDHFPVTVRLHVAN